MIEIAQEFLPDGFDLDSISWLVEPGLWEDDFDKALILAIRRSGKFDCARYLADYPDVAASGMTAEMHYVLYGKNEHRVLHLLPTPNKSDGQDYAVSHTQEVDQHIQALEAEISRLRNENKMLLNWLKKMNSTDKGNE